MPMSKLELILKTRLICDIYELSERLELNSLVTEQALQAAQKLPLLFPESIIDRVQKGDPNDPILLQFLPSLQELEETPGFSCDPLCEQTLNAPPKRSGLPSCIMQKYYGRVLVITTNACACQCRFCFRRYYPKNRVLLPLLASADERAERESESDSDLDVDKVFESVRNDDSISEIILSGGDPLTLSNDKLKLLLHYIGSIAHVKRVRFHSRVPILSPQRIDGNFPTIEDFLPLNTGDSRVLHLVLHVNSPNEIDENVAEALISLRRKGFVLTSQTTLLKGINDNVDTLATLYEKLINLGAFPYYLHQLDRVQGAAHFETPVTVGREIIRRLSEKLPGYAVPRYVREIPGRLMKTNLFNDLDSN